MRTTKRSTTLLLTLITACGAMVCGPGSETEKRPYQAPLLDGQLDGIVDLVAPINFGQTRTGSFSDTRFLGFVFDAHAGARVTLGVSVLGDAGADDPVVLLYGPADERGVWGAATAVNDDRDTHDLNARIADLELTAEGSYLVLVNSYTGQDTGEFTLTLSCLGACGEPACPDDICDLYCEDGFRTDASGCRACQCSEPGQPCAADADCPAGYHCEMPDRTGTQSTDPGRCRPDPCTCDDVYDPVCGEDGRTYASPCVATCRDVAVSADGPCPCDPSFEPCCERDSDCKSGQTCVEDRCQGADCGCPDSWQPVCGVRNGVARTYSNFCAAECAGAHVIFLGECPDSCLYGGECIFDEDCPADHVCENCACIGTDCACPEHWSPVCAETPDGDVRTFGNDCEAACVDARILYSGECQDLRGDCTDDDECPAGYFCNTCPPDPDCPDCEVCGPPTCEPLEKPCEADQDCAPGYHCEFCPEDPSCPDCDVCGPPTCLPDEAPCHEDADCPAGFACVGAPDADDCPPGDPDCAGTCRPEDEGCVVTGCNREICALTEEDSDCHWQPDYECLQFAVCDRTTDPNGNLGCGWQPTPEFEDCMARIENRSPCATDAECGSGEFCLDGYCHGQQCACPDLWEPVCGAVLTADGEEHQQTFGNLCELECTEATYLYGGECGDIDTPGCTDDSQCPDGYRCDIYWDQGEANGYCVPDSEGTPCQSNADCPAGLVCDPAIGLCR